MKKLIILLAVFMAGCPHGIRMQYNDLVMVCTTDFASCECEGYDQSLAAFINCTCSCNRTAIIKKD